MRLRAHGHKCLYVLPATLLAAAAVATPAGGSSNSSQLIRPAVGIGKVRLGMSLADVRRALGRDFAVNRRLRRGFGTTYVELGWDYSWWRVGFLVRRGQYREHEDRLGFG
jgi:hypothetical protein